MILDDGGDATLLLHLGARAEQDIHVLDKPTSEEEKVLYASIKKKLTTHPTWYSERLAAVKGVTEETTTGVHRLYQMHKRGELKFPAINGSVVNRCCVFRCSAANNQAPTSARSSAPLDF